MKNTMKKLLALLLALVLTLALAACGQKEENKTDALSPAMTPSTACMSRPSTARLPTTIRTAPTGDSTSTASTP